MKKYTEIETHVEVQKTKKCTSVVCDLCKVETPREPLQDWPEYNRQWTVTTDVSIGLFSKWPECGGESRRYDICPACFEDKLEPWLKSQGANPTEEDY